ncbi:MAG: uracil-DNA glycosylase [Lachnospiraceae bacterium]|nr:uracil-DNA glycosylase [Lachnospiraceae bacterium]
MDLEENTWKYFFRQEKEKEYLKKLEVFVKDQYSKTTVFPAYENIFNAYRYTKPKDIKAVILGQDPYHNVGQAHGLAFSVNKGVALPPSLVNIYKELEDDLGIKTPDHGFLEKWAMQGVMLLNTVLTVRAHEANSHKGMGWETFTDNTIKYINELDQPIVFLLWGSPAQQKAKFLNNKNHLVLKAPHPSPLSAYRGFFGCKHFSMTNESFIVPPRSDYYKPL